MSLKFGLIGKKLSHSFSQSYFTEKFRTEGIPAEYHNYELKGVTELQQFLNSNPDVRGLNVTIPYKQSVIPFLDELDPIAEKIGAVNTIRIRNQKLIGYNTDVDGFRESLIGFYPEKFGGTALVLGSGGASKAVYYTLDHFFNFDRIIKVSREPKTSAMISYWDLDEIKNWEDYPLIVNTTPLGMHPEVDTFPDIPYAKLSPDHYLFDLVYNPSETQFMKRGREYGARVKNGMEMLIGQAESSWKIWGQGVGV